MLLQILVASRKLVETLTTIGMSTADPLFSLVAPDGGDRPQVSIRSRTTGVIAKAEGDTGAALSYSDRGAWLLNIIDESLYEVQLSQDSVSGAAGTMTGEPLGSFQAMTLNRTWTWTKDSNAVGTATFDGTMRIQEIADTSNFVSLAINMDCQITA